jgi:tRNA (guanine37-N1)-methyltransferase
MRIDILTLFPDMFRGPFDDSIIQRGIERRLVTIATHDIREFALGRHRVVDDYPYGGGPGMVMKPEPVAAALEAVQESDPSIGPVVLLTPQGSTFDQSVARRYAGGPRLTLLCGRYEGVDERIRSMVDEELSLGDFVLSGGEPAAIVVVDAVVRLIPGVLGSEESLVEESHSKGLLEYPQYTRPPTFRGMDVPAILLSGNHQEVARWRRLQSILRTSKRRPDLLANASLTPEEWASLEQQRASGGDRPANDRAEMPAREGP